MKIINIFFVTIIFWSTSTLAAIVQNSDFESIKNLMQKANEETLVIFDVQDVLLEPLDQILKVNNKKYSDIIKNELIISKFPKVEQMNYVA